MFKIYFYQDQRGDSPVRDFLKELTKKSRSKVTRYIELLQREGPNLLRPYADHVSGKIRELRVKVLEGNIRIFYFFFEESTIILLHVFKKKTQELPEREIEQAHRNMQDFLEQYRNGEIILQEKN